MHVVQIPQQIWLDTSISINWVHLLELVENICANFLKASEKRKANPPKAAGIFY